MLGRVWRIDAAYQLLNLEAVDAEIAQIAQLAESTRLPLARWHLLRQQASRAALAGQLAVARDRSAEARRLAVRLQDPSGAGLSYVFAVWLAVIRGDAGEIPADFFDVAAAAPPIPIVRAALARALFVVGRTDEAQAVYETLRELPAAGDKDTRTFGALTQMIDLIIAFRDSEMAQATYDLIYPHVNDSGATGTGVVFLSGSAALAAWPAGGAARPHRGSTRPLRRRRDDQHPARRQALGRPGQAGLGRRSAEHAPPAATMRRPGSRLAGSHGGAPPRHARPGRPRRTSGQRPGAGHQSR